jgi:hypothetical protein
MFRLRTIILLVLTGLCGLGLGLLSFFKDGMYSAICLLAFPFLVALMYVVVIIDLVNSSQPTVRSRESKTQAALPVSVTVNSVIRQTRAAHI